MVCGYYGKYSHLSQHFVSGLKALHGTELRIGLAKNDGLKKLLIVHARSAGIHVGHFRSGCYDTGDLSMEDLFLGPEYRIENINR